MLTNPINAENKKDFTLKKQALSDFCDRVEEELLDGNDELFSQYVRLMSVGSYGYSPFNSMLAFYQKPESKLVGSITRIGELAKEQGHEGKEKRSKAGKAYKAYVYPRKGSTAAYVWCPRTGEGTRKVKDENGNDTGETETYSFRTFAPGTVWAIEGNALGSSCRLGKW